MENNLLNHDRIIHSLYEISINVSSSLDIQEVLDKSLEKTIEVLGLDAGAVCLFDPHSNSLVLRASYGLSSEFINSIRVLKTDDGYVGKAFITGEILAIEDITNMPRSTLEAVKKEGLTSGVYVPLKSKKDKVLGVMAVGKKGNRKFNKEEISIFDSIGRLIGVAVENANLYRETKKKARQIEIVNEFGKLVSTSLDINEIMKVVAEKMGELIPFDVGAVHLLDNSKKRFNFLYFFQDRAVAFKKAIDVQLEGTAFESCVREKSSFLRQDLKQEAVFYGEKVMLEKFGIRSMIASALIFKEETTGFLSLGRREPNAYTRDDIELLEVVLLQVASSIHSARLFENILHAKIEWENTFDSMKDLISIHDIDFNILRVNKSLAKKVNIKPEDLIGKKCYEIFKCDAKTTNNCPHIESMEKRKYCEKEIDGKGLLEGSMFLVSASPISDNQGNATGSIHIMNDITEKKIAERELVESNKRLKETLQKLEITQEQLLQADKLSAVGQLVSGVAHELNNPLTSVIGYSQLLMRKETNENLRNDAERVFNEANRAAKIVGNLLTFARQKRPEKKYIDINEALKKTLELRAYEMKVSNIEIVENFDKNLPSTMADFHQLQQVFLNIIINAEQAITGYNNSGRLEVKTEIIRSQESKAKSQNLDKDEGFIRVSFKDSGTGISEENLKKIFDPFFTTKPVGKGTGLGLSLSYGIVKEHGGRIYAKNNPDKGATFFIELPVIKDSAKVQSKEEFIEPKMAENRRILVVDDEEAIRSLLNEVLGSRGHKVELAKDGSDAANKIKRKNYDLIISDIKMPYLDGKALYDLVRMENPFIADRIIFITGDTINPETASFLQKIGNIFIKKPFYANELIKAIDEVLVRNVH